MSPAAIRVVWSGGWLLVLGIVITLPFRGAYGASHRTENFIVTAPTSALARELAESAERYRYELAQEWFATELTSWEEPCPIAVVMDDRLRARGETSYVFRGRRPVSWYMYLQGSQSAIRQSILPHEITHTVFATYFGCPLPRWAEEGACVYVEHRRERRELERLLPNHLRRGEFRRLDDIFRLQDYPSDILPLYAQGYSLVTFLISQRDKQTFVHFLGDGLQTSDWRAATQKHYEFGDLQQLEAAWLSWATSEWD